MLPDQEEDARQPHERAGKISPYGFMSHLERQRKHQWSQQRSNPIRAMQVVECFAERILKAERDDDVDTDIEKSKAYTRYELRRQQKQEQVGPGNHNASTCHNRQSAHQNIFRAN